MKTRQELWDELRADLRQRGDLESWSTRDLATVLVSLALLAGGGALIAWGLFG